MPKVFLFAAILIATANAALAADPVEGLWKTALQDDGGYGFVQIAPCGAAFCGTLIKGCERRGRGGDIWRRYRQADYLGYDLAG